MTAKPSLPGGFELPDRVNGWVHAPDSNRNGHVWTAADAPRSVGVFSTFSETVRVAVFDDRVSGFASKIEPIEREIRDDEPREKAVAWAVERASDWMNRHDPDEWDHPHVEEAVFDPPVGYVLDRYYLEQREQILYYRREDAERAVKMAGGRRADTEPAIDTRAYLYVQAWRGSGNATVALAPWLRAHDHERHEVVDPPAECGLAVALKLAREWVREQTGVERETPAVGQADLSAF